MNVTAVLFPGQGSQEPGMGRDAAEASVEIMDIWKMAEQASGQPLREIYWESGDAALQADTRSLQPALTVTALGLWLLMAPRFRPACVAGHSLGEYAALVAAGSLSLNDAINLVCLRGRLMAEADPEGKGGMAAVLKLSLADVEAIVAESHEATGRDILVANYNTPGQFVISGAKQAIEDAAERAKARKGRAIPLAVSGAFHSPLMAGAAKELERALGKVTFSQPRCPVYCNVTGQAVAEKNALQDCLRRQMTAGVRWIDTVANQWKAGVRHWVEIGPKGVLTKMVGPILDDLPETQGTYTVENISDAGLAAAFQR